MFRTSGLRAGNRGAAADDGPAADAARAGSQRSSGPSTCPSCSATTRRLRAATGWEPEIALDQTLADCWTTCATASGVAAIAHGPDHAARLAQQLALTRRSRTIAVDRSQPGASHSSSTLAALRRSVRSSQARSLSSRDEQHLDLGVASGHAREPLGLGQRIARPGDQLTGLDLEDTRQQHDGALARVPSSRPRGATRPCARQRDGRPAPSG